MGDTGFDSVLGAARWEQKAPPTWGVGSRRAEVDDVGRPRLEGRSDWVRREVLGALGYRRGFSQRWRDRRQTAGSFRAQDFRSGQ